MLRSPAVYARPAEAQVADPRPACHNGLIARCPKMVPLRVSSPVLRRSRGARGRGRPARAPAGRLERLQDRYDAAREQVTRVLTICRELGDRGGELECVREHDQLGDSG